MTPKQFLEAVWPSDGQFCIAVPAGKGYRHKVCATIDEAVTYVEKIKDTHDVFFCIHTLKEPRVWNPAKKNHDGTVGGWSYRLQSNMRNSRAFFFDIDVGTGRDGKYASRREAAEALFQFIADVDLPKPMLTSSGGGIHVYWLLEDAIPSNEWVAHASHLKQLALHHGLKIDPTRTTDTASVLRVVGTFNLKRGEKRPVVAKQRGDVTPNDEFIAKLDAALVAANMTPRQQAMSAAPSSLDALMGSNTSMAFDGAPVSAKEVLQSCGQLRWMAIEQDKVSQPEWYAGLGVMVHTSTPDAIHKFSEKYPGYDPGETERKADQQRAINQPTSCQKLFDVSSRPDVCRTCPLFNAADNSFKVKGPMIGARNRQNSAPPKITELVGNVEVTYEVPPPPGAYRRPRDGGVQLLIEKDGKEMLVPIYPYDLYPLWRADNDILGAIQRWRHHPPHSDGPVDIEISGPEWGSDQAMKVKLATNAIYPENYERLKTYMSAYIRELMKRQPAIHQHSNLGWTSDMSGFVLPSATFRCDGTKASASLGPVAASIGKCIVKAGSLLNQVKQLKFFNDKRYVPVQMYIVSSLASALFSMTGHNGVVVNAVGLPGASKSTALKTAAGFWGKPDEYVINGTQTGATALFRTTYMQALGSLPTPLDEITHIASEVAQAMTMGVTQAIIIKKGLKSDGTIRQTSGAVRSSILMSTSNRALQSVLSVNNEAGTASAIRVVEIKFDRLGIHTPFEADVYMRGVRANYGHIGEVFISHCATRLEEIGARYLKELEDLGIKGNMTPDERFWFSWAAMCIIVAEILRELGLASWSADAFREWFLTVQLPEMRGIVTVETQKNAPITVLTDYIEHVHSDLVKTDMTAGGFNVLEKPRGEMKGHWEMDKKSMWLLRQPFISYCISRKVFANDILQELQRTGLTPETNKRHILGDGTVQAKLRSYCIRVDLSHPDLAAVKPALASAGGNVVTMPQKPKPSPTTNDTANPTGS